MKIAIIIHSDVAETVWNAFRLANFALKEKDNVKVFLLAKGVESESLSTEKFDVKKEMESFIANGGNILACGTCLKMREQKDSELCPFSTMQDLYHLVKDSDRVLTF